jgi:hypothetical protein
MRPLEVWFRLASPLAYAYRRAPHPLHFDALVVALMAARDGRVLGRGYDPARDPYAPERWPGNGVPLAVAGSSRPVYCASAVELAPGPFDPDARAWDYWWVKPPSALPDVARFSDYGRTRGDVVRPGSGEFRAWQDCQVAAVVRMVRFFCVGDPDALEDLLRPFAEGRGALGTRRAAGLGEVVEHRIREAPADLSLVDASGRPARALPVEDWPEGWRRGWQRGWWASRPPYWAVENRSECWVPPVSRWYPTV